VFGHGLAARFLNASSDDELMNLGHVGTLTDLYRILQCWTLPAQAIRKVFDSLAISMCR
jgi:hypothetical protein